MVNLESIWEMSCTVLWDCGIICTTANYGSWISIFIEKCRKFCFVYSFLQNAKHLLVVLFEMFSIPECQGIQSSWEFISHFQNILHIKMKKKTNCTLSSLPTLILILNTKQTIDFSQLCAILIDLKSDLSLNYYTSWVSDLVIFNHMGRECQTGYLQNLRMITEVKFWFILAPFGLQAISPPPYP